MRALGEWVTVGKGNAICKSAETVHFSFVQCMFEELGVAEA